MRRRSNHGRAAAAASLRLIPGSQKWSHFVADSSAGTMETSLYGIHGDADNLGDFRSGKPFDIAQQEHFTDLGSSSRIARVKTSSISFAAKISSGSLRWSGIWASTTCSSSGSNLPLRLFLIQKLRAILNSQVDSGDRP